MLLQPVLSRIDRHGGFRAVHHFRSNPDSSALALKYSDNAIKVLRIAAQPQKRSFLMYEKGRT
jgi:hypothetical protein